MEIECDVYETRITSDGGREVDGVVAECTACHYETESYGTGSASVNRCLALMRDECPMGERNFYVQA